MASKNDLKVAKLRAKADRALAKGRVIRSVELDVRASNREDRAAARRGRR
jgi:hypothetical protein